jgi:hypothetical protein
MFEREGKNRSFGGSLIRSGDVGSPLPEAPSRSGVPERRWYWLLEEGRRERLGGGAGVRVAALWLKNESLAVLRGGWWERESEAERLTFAPPTPELYAKVLVSLLLLVKPEAEDMVDDREGGSLDIDFDFTSGAGGVGAAAKFEQKNALVRLVVEPGLPLPSLAVGDSAPVEDPPRVGECSPSVRPYSDAVPVGEGRGEMRVVGGASLPRLLLMS